MTLHPILAALRRHKSGVVLISMQIALTLAIVCNAIFIIGQRIDRVNRLTGLDESNLFLVTQQWVGAPGGDDPAGVEKLDSMQKEDLVALRTLPDVASVASINSLPLLNSSSNGSISLKPGSELRKGTTRTTFYYGDEQMISTLGLRLIAGRAFNAGDIQHRSFRDQTEPSVVIVTKPIADKLFPQGSAVGKAMYLNGSTAPTTIIGVVERLQVPGAGSWTNDFAYNATLEPTRLDGNFARYVVRAKPGRLEAAMRAIPSALYSVNRLRVLDDDDSVKSFADIRASAYRADIGMAILMGVVCLVLLGVTAAGIVGLTSFWVGQRHRQIGVRRALGARKIDILHYFQIENLMIAGGGAIVGVALAVGLNAWLMKHFEMDRIPVAYVLVGLVALVALGQAAVFVPARRASNVSPIEATRAV
jgi:putative ABC transport system permease protein